jgi:hypothetical protein
MADVMEREENPPPNNLWEWLLSNASKLRDLALAGAAGTYALGFIIWSIHASVDNLGLLPALDSQYIIAGILPVTILGLAVTAVYVTIKRKNLRLRVFAVAGCVSLFLGFGFSIVGFYFLNISEALISTVGTILGSISWLLIFIGAYAAIVRWAADILPPRDLDLFLRFFVVVLTLWSVIMGISEYALVVYQTFRTHWVEPSRAVPISMLISPRYYQVPGLPCSVLMGMQVQ